MSASTKPDIQLRHKKNLVRLGLIEADWERSIRRGATSARYRMTPKAKDSMRRASCKTAACQ